MSLVQRVQRRLRRRRPLELDPELAGLERVFRAPPFSPAWVAAIQRISPQLALRADEASRRLWEMDQNGACWGEYHALRPWLEALPRPRQVLEIGPGLGRSVVFFKHRLGWQDVPFHLYEADGSDTKYTVLGPRFDDSFCGDVALLQQSLAYNGVENARIFDAAELGGRLSGLPGPYDWIYGFYSVGFHWSLEHFLDEILGLMHETTLCSFIVPRHFEAFPRLRELPHRIVDCKSVWPKDRVLRMLLLGEPARAAAQLGQ